MPRTITYTGTIASRRRLALYDLETYLGREQLHRIIHGLWESCNWDDQDHSADPQLKDFIRTLEVQLDLMLGVSGLPVACLIEFLGFPPTEVFAEIDHEIYHRNAPRLTINTQKKES